jgi:hypothetical protein
MLGTSYPTLGGLLVSWLDPRIRGDDSIFRPIESIFLPDQG